MTHFEETPPAETGLRDLWNALQTARAEYDQIAARHTDKVDQLLAERARDNTSPRLAMLNAECSVIETEAGSAHDRETDLRAQYSQRYWDYWEGQGVQTQRPKAVDRKD